MERLNVLSVALGLACLAGLNLYLTVFATGLAIHFHWITLSGAYQSLEVLGHPMVMTIAGILYAVEFLADKIPWVDSAWDAVHTVIRPIGGALLAIQTLGHPDPAFAVIVGLLAGGTTLIAHTAKSATRLTSNASPEPFSNVALSFGEDAAVLGGLALIYHNPIIALIIFVLAIAAFVYFAPKILRAMRGKIWLALNKLNFPANIGLSSKLPISLSPRLAEIFSHQNTLSETIVWAAPCLSGRGRGIPPNLFGALIATNEEPDKLLFVARKGRRSIAQTIELNNLLVAHEAKFLSDNLVFLSADGKRPKYTFVFSRSRAAMVDDIMSYIQSRSSALSHQESKLPAESIAR